MCLRRYDNLQKYRFSNRPGSILVNGSSMRSTAVVATPGGNFGRFLGSYFAYAILHAIVQVQFFLNPFLGTPDEFCVQFDCFVMYMPTQVHVRLVAA